MLDVDFAELKAGFIKNAPVGAFIGGVVLIELAALFLVYGFDLGVAGNVQTAMPSTGSGIDNTTALGRVIYTKYVYFFQASGLILLVAMIGAIVLTLRHKEGVKRQSVAAQVARSPKTAIEVVEVAPGNAVLPSTEGQN
jgi:NADH-quinone oxidoreductase subunit J